MSSIFIKDIFGKERPMPQEGYIDVRLHFRGGRVECATMQTGNPPFYATFKTVEIPPHGRLIDAEKLKRHIDKLPALPDGNFAGTHRNLKALINMQKTVIEAEGSE